MAATSTAPRVAVVGGGIAGTLCSWVLQKRGLQPTIIDQGRQVGGRLRRVGCQFLRVTDPKLATLVQFLQDAGLVAPWEGRFGLLGSAGGGFLPASVVASVANNNHRNNPQEGDQEETTAPTPCVDGGDFCRFVEGRGPLYVGVPSMAGLCPGIVQRAGISTLPQSTVTQATPLQEGGWTLDMENKESSSFDALVVATHDPSVGARAIRSIVQAEENENAAAATTITERLEEIAHSLQQVRDQHRQPVYTVSLQYPAGFGDEIPFDAVSVPGSHTVQFLAREASKPQQQPNEIWTAVTTSRLAATILADASITTDQEKRQQIETLVAQEVSQLVADYTTSTTPSPLEATSYRWGAAFSSPGLQLQEDSIFFAPWRLALCGDYIKGHQTPMEAAALSGLQAGERIAALLLDDKSSSSA